MAPLRTSGWKNESNGTKTELICVKKVPGKGRGVFAKSPIARGGIIERVPVLLIPIKDFVNGIDNPTLKKYLYIWNKKAVAVSLGYGSLYNHSYQPNAEYIPWLPAMMTYRALRPIAPGEEITINYNFDPHDQTPVVISKK